MLSPPRCSARRHWPTNRRARGFSAGRNWSRPWRASSCPRRRTRRPAGCCRAPAPTTYIAGIADATSGTRWCGAGTVVPHEPADRVHTHLGDLPTERLNENAATLVGEALAQSFPCGSQAVVTGSRNTMHSLDNGDDRVVRN
ncbi:Rap1a/Tai family immunity protein [Sinorhizobium americanum]|uniref:Rap1a/Tai family immunity protein n=1 Tax=Sinorhizobium americanum TaxID=194963 RepID=UPI001FD90A7A|nr:Rap1a/Tai family immunity protein [Sinorhizobium americanum]